MKPVMVNAHLIAANTWLAFTIITAPKHHGGRAFGYRGYKADLSKAKSATQGIYDACRSDGCLTPWTTLRLPLTAFSADWSDFSGECNTTDPDGYQHRCCDRSGMPPFKEPCPTTTGLGSIIGLSLWSEGVLGDFEIEIKSISIEI